MKRLFGGFKMSWRKLIAFSVLTAVYTATVNLIPIFKDTSFQQIEISI